MLRLGDEIHEIVQRLRRQGRLPPGNRSNGVDQLLDLTILRQISTRSSANRSIHEIRIATVHSQNDDLRLRKLPVNRGSGLQVIVARRVEPDQHDVWLKRSGLVTRLVAGRRLANDLQIWEPFQQSAESLPKHATAIHQEQPEGACTSGTALQLECSRR